MELTSEEVVTRLLSKKEILESGTQDYLHSNPIYDLNNHMKNYKPEPGRFGNKYVFVKWLFCY